MESSRFVTTLFSLVALLCGHAHADTPHPSVAYECLSAQDKLIVSVTTVYDYDSPYEPKTVEETCKLSSGTYKTIMTYSLVEKCGVMSVEIEIYRGAKSLIRKEVGVGYCYGPADSADEKVKITIIGRTGKVVTKDK